jgi:hypothetical protein
VFSAQWFLLAVAAVAAVAEMLPQILVGMAVLVVGVVMVVEITGVLESLDRVLLAVPLPGLMVVVAAAALARLATLTETVRVEMVLVRQLLAPL